MVFVLGQGMIGVDRSRKPSCVARQSQTVIYFIVITFLKRL